GYSLSQNYPNPFNPSTRIDYNLPSDSRVTLDIYNITGEKVSQLVNKEQPAGYYSVNFGSSKLSSGVYFYRITAVDKSNKNNFSEIKKMILLK
ncbi:MAG: T9SS type A sorting domain-containing protein, partial [Ignavibacteriaceae bacterium]|nr:T9SS type A sorting domain-containing protein [Ignavibacteriaceae bacterium]